MKYYYYVIQFSQPLGYSNQCGLYRKDFFDWNDIRNILKESGVNNPILTFFKEINKQEYLSFAESFKK